MLKRKFKSRKEAYDYYVEKVATTKSENTRRSLEANYLNAILTLPTPTPTVGVIDTTQSDKWFEAFSFDTGNVPLATIRLNTDGSVSI